MSSKLNVAKLIGAEKVVDLLGDKSIAHDVGEKYLESLDVTEQDYISYQHDNPRGELLGVDEVMKVMREAGLRNIGTAASVRKEINERSGSQLEAIANVHCNGQK